MADSNVAITAGSGTSIDTRTEATNGHHRQVVVIGDPSTNAGVAPVDATNGLSVDVKASALPTGAATSAKQDIGNTSLATVAGAVSGTEMQVDVLTSALPTGASTAAKQPALGTAGTPSADVITIQGVTSMTAVKVDGSGVTQPVSGTVGVTGVSTVAEQQTQTTHLSTIAGDTTSIQTAVELIDDAIYTDGSGTPSKAIGIAGTDGTNPQILKTDSAGELQVDVLTMPTVTVTATNLDVQSGGADLATSAQGSAIQTAVEIIDNAISGTEMQVDVVGALPAGTNAIGKLAANSGVDIGDVTLTAGAAAIGTILPPDIDITTHTNYAKKYYTNAGAVTDGIVWSPASGKRWHVVSMYIQTSAAATVTLEDDLGAGDSAVWKGELAANGGMTINFSEHYPLASGEDAADLLVTTSAGNIYITITGYEI